MASKSDGLSELVELALGHRSPSRGEAVRHLDEIIGSERTQRSAERERRGTNESETLLLRVQQHDPEALSELFDRYCRLVFSIGYRVLHTRVEAEDLVQDVFLFLWSRSNLFVPGKLSGHEWIIRIIYHRAFDRRRYLITRLSYNFNGDGGSAGTSHPERNDDRSSRLVSSEGNFGESLYWRSHLEAAFEELSEAQRTTLLLFFYQGYSLAEIGEELNESLVNVRNHYYRGLRHLGKVIDPEGKKE